MPMNPATPVSPEEWLLPDAEGMQKHADLARLGCGGTLPLALLAQRTGTTTADAGSIDHPQASIGFSAVFMGNQVPVSGAPQRAIGLEGKVLSRETARFPGQGDRGRTIALPWC